MQKTAYAAGVLALIMGLGVGVQGVHADNDIWDMMNPAWWMGLDDDDDDWEYWYYGPGRYARGGPGPYGWGGYPYGPGYYGWGGYPGHYGYGGMQQKAEKAPLPIPD